MILRGSVGMSRGQWGLVDIKGGKWEFIDISRSQKILTGVAGIKLILWILAILRGVNGVMGPIDSAILHTGLTDE